jgi:hypothetical protein
MDGKTHASVEGEVALSWFYSGLKDSHYKLARGSCFPCKNLFAFFIECGKVGSCAG